MESNVTKDKVIQDGINAICQESTLEIGQFYSDVDVDINNFTDEDYEQAEAHCALFVDAMGVMQSVGKSPSELLQQNSTLIEQNRKLWNKLSELYEAYGSAVDITPELLQSVTKTIKDTENGK